MKAKKVAVSRKRSKTKANRTTNTVKRLNKKLKGDIGSKIKSETVKKALSKQPKSGLKGTSAKKVRKDSTHSQTKVRNNDIKRKQLKKSLRKNDITERISEKDNQVNVQSVKINTKKKSKSVMVKQATAQGSSNIKQRKLYKRTSIDVEHSESKICKVENQEPDDLPKPRSNMCKRGNTSKQKTNNTMDGKERGKQRKGLPGKSTTSDLTLKEMPQKRVTRLALLQSKRSQKEFINDTKQQNMKKEVQSSISEKKAIKRKFDILKQITKPNKQSLKLAISKKAPTINASGKRDKRRASKKITFNQEVKYPDMSLNDSFLNKEISVKAKKSLKNKGKKKAQKFLNKLKLIKKIKISPQRPVYGLSLSKDNLMWVNSLKNEVKLVDCEGHILKTYDTEFESPPVFNACTGEGDLLFTSGGVCIPKVFRIRREAEPTISVFADLSEFGKYLDGLHVTKNGHVFVLARREHEFKVVELSPNGQIIRCYNTNSFSNHIIEINCQLKVIELSSSDMFPLPDGKEGDEKIILSRHSTHFHSTSASVDRFGHLLIGCWDPRSIWIFDHLGNHLHTLPADECTEEIVVSTATDHNDHIWIGTYSGNVFIGKYLQNT